MLENLQKAHRLLPPYQYTANAPTHTMLPIPLHTTQNYRST